MKTKGRFLLIVGATFTLLVLFDVANWDCGSYKILCNSLSAIFITNCTDFYDVPFWSMLSSLGTIVALTAAWFAIRQSNKQLEIEQTPHVILDHIKRIGHRYGFAVKNVGRGPAVHIIFSRNGDATSRNEGFFSNDQNHSANFFPSEESHYWMVDENTLDELKHDENGFTHLYIFFEGQSNILYKTVVKIKRITDKNKNSAYVVMENKFCELKGKHLTA